jgi:hypothetical protein
MVKDDAGGPSQMALEDLAALRAVHANSGQLLDRDHALVRSRDL